MSLLRIRGLDPPRSTTRTRWHVGREGNLGEMSLLQIRGLDRRNTPTGLVRVGETAMGPARHPRVPRRVSLLRIRGLDRPRRTSRTRSHVDLAV